MKKLEVELEQLRLLVVAVMGREQVGGASGPGGGTVDDKLGEDDERDARESSSQPGRRLRGGKVVGRQDVRRRDVGRQDERRRERNGREDKWTEGKGSGGDSNEGVSGELDNS